MKKGKQIHPINITIGYTGITNGQKIWDRVYDRIFADAKQRLIEEIIVESNNVDSSQLNNKEH